MPLDYWGANQGGPFASASYAVISRVQWSPHNHIDIFIQGGAHYFHQPSTGPARTELMPMRRFQPYGMPSTCLDERVNAEAGPSTLAPPHFPYVDWTTSQPSGGRSETTADAEQHQTLTEEDRATVSNFYCSRVPRVTEWSFGVRGQSGPGFPEAKEGRAHPVCRRWATPTSYATGHSGKRSFRKLRASTRL